MKLRPLNDIQEELDTIVKNIDKHIKQLEKEDRVAARYLREQVRYQVSVAASNLEHHLEQVKK